MSFCCVISTDSILLSWFFVYLLLFYAKHYICKTLSKNNLRHQEDIGFLQRSSARSEALVIQDRLNPISVTKII